MEKEFHCLDDVVFKRKSQQVFSRTYKEYSVKPHTHDFYEMNLVLSGHGIHYIKNAEFPVKRGDLFVIPPMTVHAYDNTEHLTVCHILMKKKFISSNADAQKMPGFLQLMELESFVRQNYPQAIFLRLTPVQIDEVMNDARFLQEKGQFDDERFDLLAEATTWKIVYYLSYLLRKQLEQKESVKAKYERELMNTLEYLSKHFSEKITIDDLASRIFLSRSTFLRRFFEFCGCTPMQYLSFYRTKKAVELLETATLNKTEIAHLCGFYDLSHMERNVKRFTTPSITKVINKEKT